MGRITVNPEAQSATGFPLWGEGTYRLRIDEVEETQTSTGKAQLAIRLSSVDGNVVDELGKPLPTPGTLRDWVTVDPIAGKNGGTVSFLRALVEAAGLPWSDFDTHDLVGRELTAKVGIREREGRKNNRIVRYVKA